MNDQIKARGWLWERSEKPTQWLALRCQHCGHIETYPVNTSDGKCCPRCESGLYVAIGYVRKAREIKR